MLDRLLILGRRHLERVIAGYTRHCNEHRPHRWLDQRPPLAQPPGADLSDLEAVDRRLLTAPGGVDAPDEEEVRPGVQTLVERLEAARAAAEQAAAAEQLADVRLRLA